MPTLLEQEALAVFRHVVKIRASVPDDDPIKITFWNETKAFKTVCAIKYSINGETRAVPANFHFDGASIPRLLWWIGGFSPLDRDTLLAACLHDYLLDHSTMRRVMADAWFVSVLSGATLNGRNLAQCSERRAKLMYYAVRWWSIRQERKRKRRARRAAAR